MKITARSILRHPDSVQLSKHALAMGIDTFQAHIKLALLTALGLLILSILADSPYTAILVLDLLFCGYLISIFKNKYRFLFMLHPVILAISSQLYTMPFLLTGDGEVWVEVIGNYLDIRTFEFHGNELISDHGLLTFFKSASLGIVPIYAVPEFFFQNPEDAIYYLWQGTFHVFLSGLVVTLAQSWRVLERKYLFSVALFTVIGPSFFDLGVAPTRHILTFFGVYLLLVTHLAVMQRFTLSRLVWYAIAVAVILICKMPLLVPYFIFVLIDMFYIRPFKLKSRNVMLLGIFVLALALMWDTFFEVVVVYNEISKTGAGFSGVNELPIIGWIEKYIYALLSPFPWLKSYSHIEGIYSGNWFLFFMHTLSAITGVYLFFVVFLKWRAILSSDIQLKQLVAFALIMSLSILKGTTGFHSYILIYFPMLVPLLTIKQFRINPMLPIGFIIFLEVIMLTMRF